MLISVVERVAPRGGRFGGTPLKPLPIAPLDARKQFILKAVVTDYVETAEPVGSHSLIERHEFGVKAATIRNEMAELSDLGYLRQPHTSAGRIPSDQGYRFYVDRLMDQVALSRAEATTVRKKMEPHSTEMDFILEQTCKILSGLARYTSLATLPAVSDAVVSHISVTSVAGRKLLAVLVLDNGAVIHELLDVDSKSGKTDPVRATNFLTERLAGRTLASLDGASIEPLPDQARDMGDLLRSVLRFVRRELQSAEESGIHLEGASYIMQQPEFRDASRLETVLSLLEGRQALYRLFSSVYLGPEVTVIIGAENPVDEMSDCSFVGTKYRVGDRIAGTIGVVGPTRMDYRRAVAAVEFMARNLEQLLAELRVV